jgi:type IV pilus assembly protein PilM
MGVLAMAGGPQNVIGLDIGTSTVKAVQVRRGKQRLEIVGFGIMPTPPGTVDNHVVVDPPALGAALRQMLHTSGIRCGQAISSVGGQSSLVVRITEVPKMSERELREAMQYDVERHIPFPASEVQMDFVPIDRPDADPNAPNMEILLAVAQDEMINSHVAALEAAGLQPLAIDVEPLAATRALVNVDEPRFAGQTVVVVNIGDTTTDISIIRDGYLRFVRSIPMAGANLTRAISQSFIVDTDEATRLKHKYAAVLDGARYAGMRETVAFAEQPRPEELEAGFGVIPGMPSEPAVEEPEPEPPAPEPAAPEGPPGLIAFSLEEEENAPTPEEEAAAAPPLQFDLGEEEEPVSMALDIGAPPPPKPEEPAAPPPVQEAPPEAAAVLDVGAWGAPSAAGPLDTSDERHTREQISDVIVPVLGELATEIRRSLEFYRRQHRNENVDRLMLVGGTALVEGLAQFMANEVGVPTEIGDPFAVLDLSAVGDRINELRQIAPAMTISVGLAIRDMLPV